MSNLLKGKLSISELQKRSEEIASQDLLSMIYPITKKFNYSNQPYNIDYKQFIKLNKILYFILIISFVQCKNKKQINIFMNCIQKMNCKKGKSLKINNNIKKPVNY